MNWYEDEEYDNCAPGAFGGDYSPYDNDRDDEPNDPPLWSEGMFRLVFGLGNFIANDCGSSYD